MSDQEHHAQLRAWAKGMWTTEAGTELLIRAFNGRYAGHGWPWIERGEPARFRSPWIDFEAIPVQLGALSGGEQRLLRIAASIGSRSTEGISLSDNLPGLDDTLQRLVLAAVAHAMGAGYLYPWPEEES